MKFKSRYAVYVNKDFLSMLGKGVEITAYDEQDAITQIKDSIPLRVEKVIRVGEPEPPYKFNRMENEEE